MTWNASSPDLGQSIAADIADILENFNHTFPTDGNRLKFNAPISTPSNSANTGFVYLKDVSSKAELHFEDEDGNEIQLTSAGAVSVPSVIANFPGLVMPRSLFRWKDADEIYIGGGTYHHEGTSEQFVYWNSELTFKLGSGGSNSDSSDLDAGAVDMQYIYLDDSAIVTQGAALLDADCFLNSDTAPTWDETKKGYYNGSDRCIFAVVVSAANAVLQFLHDGGEYVQYGNGIEDDARGYGQSPAQCSATWADNDIVLTVPAFARKVEVNFLGIGVVSAGGTLFWRTKDVGDVGNPVYYIGSSGDAGSTVTCFVDTDLTIQIMNDTGTSHTVYTTTLGWYLPRGM